MNLNSVNQISIKNAAAEHYDFIFCATGYEERARYISSQYSFNSSKKIALGFSENKVCERNNNDLFFKENNFLLYEVNQSSYEYLGNLYNDFFSQIEKKRITIFMDITSMSTLMYAMLLHYCNYTSDFEQIQITFGYTHSEFIIPTTDFKVKYSIPVPFFDNIESTSKDISLIVGLGYEKDKALGMYEYFRVNSKSLYLFITKSNNFTETVETNNLSILSLVEENNLVYYDIDNIENLLNSLSNLTKFLTQQNYRVVVVPSGPKIFTLASLMVGLEQNISIYRVSSEELVEVINKKPDITKEPLALKVEFINA